MKNWLEGNKVYFETVAALLLAIAGLSLTVIQGCWAYNFSSQSNQLGEKSLELAEKELKLTELQTAIAQSQISPSFVFDMEFSELMPVSVENKGAAVRRLSGKATPVLWFKRKDGQPVFIALENFFFSPHGFETEGQSLSFYSSSEFAGPVMTHFALGKRPNPTLQDIAESIEASEKGETGIPDEWTPRLGAIYSLKYIDATNTEHTQHFETIQLDRSATPVDSPPKYDATIDVDQFKTGRWTVKYDVDGLVKKVHEIVDQLNK